MLSPRTFTRIGSDPPEAIESITHRSRFFATASGRISGARNGSVSSPIIERANAIRSSSAGSVRSY
jgi:hypothetical protein